jgi:hypothetical protein
MPSQAQQRRDERIRAQRATINAGAKHLRHQAIQDSYAGLGAPYIAFSFAAVLDSIALHITELPPVMVSDALTACDRMLHPHKTKGMHT